MADSSKEYTLREIDFQGQTSLVILQNPDEWNGAIEVANLLLLKRGVPRGMKTRKGPLGEKKINLTMIQAMISAHKERSLKILVENRLITQDVATSSSALYEHAIHQPSSNFNIYPSTFKRTQDFEKNNETNLLEILVAETYHGWLLDSQDNDTSEVFGTKSCKELIKEYEDFKASKSKSDRISLIQSFLDKSRTQLTPYGFASLYKDVPEKIPSLLFRDNRLNVMYKHKETLYTLATSQDVVNNHRDAVWRKLEIIEEHGEYVTSIFDPIHTNWLEMQDILLKEEAKDKKQKQKSGKNKPKQKEKGSVIAQGESEKGPETQKEVHEEKVPEPQKEVLSLRNRFMTFLDECTHDGRSYFKGQVEMMLLTSSLHLMFCYKLIKTYDKELAVSICNNYYRDAEELRECFCDYFSKIQEESDVIQEKLKYAVMDKRDIYTKIKLTICCISQRKRILSFEEFAGANVMYMVYELDGTYINSTSYIGRMMALGYLGCITQAHKRMLSWNGGFDVSHMSVKIKNGIMKFKIKETAYMVNLTREYGIADYYRYKEILFPLFRRDDVKEYPAYFNQFVEDIMAMPDPIVSPRDFKKFLKYIKSHLFGKAPLVRSSLITDTYRVCESLVIPRPLPGSWPVYAALNIMDADLPEWDEKFLSAPLLEIFTHKSSFSTRFAKCTYWTSLMLGRHGVQHLHWFTKVNNVQTAKDLVLIELRLAHDLKGLIARVIRFIIMKHYKLDVPFSYAFSSVWRTFKASETFEKPTKDAALDGDTKNGTGAAVAIPSLGSATATSSSSGPPTGRAAKDPFLLLECELQDQVVRLSCEDLQSLEDKKHLLDAVIDFSFARMSLAFINHNDILILRTNFASMIAKTEKENVKAQLQHLELESRRLVFVPVNDDRSNLPDGGTHWSLLVIHIAEDRSSCRFVHHDSMAAYNFDAANRYANALKHVLPMASKDPVIQANTPRQLDKFNCGLCVLALTNEICTWWNRRGRSGKSNCWFEVVESNVTANTYEDTRLKLRKNLQRLALATATAAALDFAAGTGGTPALGVATPLPALNLKCEVQDKVVVELLYDDLSCLGGNGTYVVDNVVKFVYTRMSLIYQSQDLRLMWPMDVTADKGKLKSLLGSCRMVLLPVCDMDSMHADHAKHWSLLVVQINMDRSGCRFVHHDLGGVNQNVAIKYIEVLKQSLPASLPVVEDPSPEQIKVSDCGLYVLALTNAICSWWTRNGRWSGGKDYLFNVVNWGDTLSEIRVRLQQNLMKEMGVDQNWPLLTEVGFSS